MFGPFIIQSLLSSVISLLVVALFSVHIKYLLGQLTIVIKLIQTSKTKWVY